MQYKDCIEIYNNFDNITFGGNKLLAFKEKFINSLSSLLTFQVPNKIEILYNDKLLINHSLGQRASALIVFILTQKNNDIIIIDQPEDDLDNQTIYKEVIKELIKLKNTTQFIFATHNANIPILGDSEQIIVCNYEENKINIQIGSIDNHDIQDNIINIMEGGEEAFDKRRDIYNLWKH
jgi:predicted ATPase